MFTLKILSFLTRGAPHYYLIVSHPKADFGKIGLHPDKYFHGLGKQKDVIDRNQANKKMVLVLIEIRLAFRRFWVKDAPVTQKTI